MLEVGGDAVVLPDQRVKHISETRVKGIICLDVTMLVVKLESTGNSLAEGEPRGLGSPPSAACSRGAPSPFPDAI